MSQPYTFLSDPPATSISAGPPPFACTWSNDGAGPAWVRAIGELDLAAAGQLIEVLREVQHRARLIVLDLRELTFLDAAGVRAIVDANLYARRNGRRVLLVRAPNRVQKALELMGVCDDIEIYEPDQPMALLKPCRSAD
jgi:anti-anti-sigma factor